MVHLLPVSWRVDGRRLYAGGGACDIELATKRPMGLTLNRAAIRAVVRTVGPVSVSAEMPHF